MIGRYTFADVRGITIATAVPTSSLSGGGDIASKLQAKSAASLMYETFTDFTTGPASPSGPSGYPTVGDVAQLAFVGASGHGTLVVLVPAPVDSMFMGDGETVDPSTISALITSIQLYAVMPSGLAVGDYNYGFRRKLTERKY